MAETRFEILFREKQESQIYRQYEQALDTLEKKLYSDGIMCLRQILKSSLIHENEFKGLLQAIHLSIAKAYEIQNQNREALHYYQKSAEIDPKSFDYKNWYKMAILSRKEGIYGAALICIEECFKLSENNFFYSSILEQQADLYFLIEDYQTSFRKYQELQSLNFRLPRTVNLLASCSLRLGHKALHEKYLQEVFQEDYKYIASDLDREREQSKNDLKQNQFGGNSSYEVIIGIEKLTWNYFLRVLLSGLKIFNGKEISGKLRKGMSSYIIEQFKRSSPCLTFIIVFCSNSARETRDFQSDSMRSTKIKKTKNFTQ